jgi:hypothetical protein
MAVLTAAKRNKLPKSEFAEPGEGKYRMPDWQHAANAKSRAKQQLNRGKLSRDAYDKIVARANRVMVREKK